MDRSLTINPNANYPIPSINVHGDAIDGFGIGVAVGALLAIYLMTRR